MEKSVAALRFHPTLPGWQPEGPAADPIARVFPLQAAQTFLTYSATGALWQLTRALDLDHRHGLLVPEYHCGHEVEPFRRCGLKLRTYAVAEDLQVSVEVLANCIEADTRAILVTHYFGWPQAAIREIRALCDERQILLIEDCAHAFLGKQADQPLGSFGHCAVFSLRKFLPIPHGGAFTVQAELPLPGLSKLSRCPPPWPGTLTKRLLNYQKALVNRMRTERSVSALVQLPSVVLAQTVLSALRPLMPISGYDPDDEGLDFADTILSWQMHPIVAQWLPRFDFAHIQATRRSNVLHIEESLRKGRTDGCQTILPPLPEGACPLYFPLRCRQRRSALQWLLSKGVYAASWWESEYAPLASQVSDSIRTLRSESLILPIHQDLSSLQMDYLLECLSDFHKIHAAGCASAREVS